MAKKEQWHQFDDGFVKEVGQVAYLHNMLVTDLKYEVIVNKVWVASFNVVGSIKTEVRLGKESSLADLKTRVLNFFK